MPVTKKRGAIFAIYADSPQHRAPNGPSSGLKGLADENEQQAGSRSNAKLGELSPTTKKSSQPRKALAPLQPTAKSTSSTSSLKGKLVCEKEKSIPLKPRQPLAASLHPSGAIPFSAQSSTPTTTRKTVRSGSKRTIEVFSDSPRASTTSLPLIAASPAKKTRSSPGKSSLTTAALLGDKENIKPRLPDSPAGRTRSKTRQTDEDAHVSPAKERTKKVLGEEDGRVRRPVKVLGEKKGGLSALAMPLGGNAEGKTKKGRSITVFADNVLCDVSEAYGANAEEPEGFRTQRR